MCPFEGAVGALLAARRQVVILSVAADGNKMAQPGSRCGTGVTMNHSDSSGGPLRLLVMTISALSLFGCGQPSVQQATNLSPESKADLPRISAFLTNPSDRS